MEKREDHHLFYFTKREKNGIVLVLLINLFIYFIPDAIDYFFSTKDKIDYKKIEELKRLSYIADSSADEEDSSFYFQKKESKNLSIHYQNFNPNTITENEWSDLGVKPKTIATIKKYISKGGRFYKPEDLKKIWGLSTQKCDELMPYVKIESGVSLQQNKSTTPIFPKTNYLVKKATVIEINSADSLMIESLPGIGPTLTKRVIAYRNKMGGFYTIEQLKEVWGLQDSVYQKIKDKIIVNAKIIQKININQANFEQLKIHPYIGYKLASAIINFRNQHGTFKSLEDIQKIILINDEIYNKISNYLVVE
jgi:competence ComEA-like helix-hairpin-helix protein